MKKMLIYAVVMTAFISCKKETVVKNDDPVKIDMYASNREVVAPGSATFTISFNTTALVPGIFCTKTVQRASVAAGTNTIAFVVERDGVIVTDGVTVGALTPLHDMVQIPEGFMLRQFTEEKIALMVSLTTTVHGSYTIRAVQFRAANNFGGAQNIDLPDSYKTAPLML